MICLYLQSQNSKTAVIDMNHELKLIQQWDHDWRMPFHPDLQKEAVEMIFSRKRNKIDHPAIILNNAPVKRLDEHKHLGLFLNSKLSFSAHMKIAITNYALV